MSNKREDQTNNKVKCSCRGNNLDKLLQPKILILLFHEQLHGYSIKQALENQALPHEERADTAGIYRTLKVMEEKFLIESTWDVQEAGAPRRIYAITPAGIACLENWIDTLEAYQQTIQGIVTAAKECLNHQPSGGKDHE